MEKSQRVENVMAFFCWILLMIVKIQFQLQASSGR